MLSAVRRTVPCSGGETVQGTFSYTNLYEVPETRNIVNRPDESDLIGLLFSVPALSE
jgi:hypothetical protein